ncbi:MAG: cytochrome C oxidase subunit IV family protein [Sphingobacteriales bacterium]|jgi:cytochrome c oxidase subunit 4|nr:cytochrome C oxidase subunit IV family protein [Sphingobacteriales bacterium]MBP9142699.1 cytochrome C oxidase subunit IV family protein [Chitinophagales bacterium]MDA0198871.1 cytochrome C oxidase subunit IV family protein [Bacteroidota bacterium]MBK6889773.1 cytochrome C oxidase subunit IV family protein [Sphingobacteriales bacterium]MBK7527711.1 cytochrome C oxidase subunit IV family protein [Sphingobacteriales bacterium]
MGHTITEAQYKQQVSAVWRATIWLGLITVVEVAAALYWYYNVDHSTPKLFLNGFFILASLLKAYFIVAEFMHVRYETRALTLTILTPMLFLIWFIIAFLWEGGAWKENRSKWKVEVERNDVKRAEELKAHGHGADSHGNDTHKAPADHKTESGKETKPSGSGH